MSLLGLVLMAASAVTAAVLPDKADGKRTNNGTLRANSNTVNGPAGVVSCFDDEDTVDSCTATASITTGSGQDDSTVNGLQTQGNTSQTAAQAGDQNSVLIQG